MLGPFIQSFMLVGVIYFYSKSILSLINDYYKDEFKNQFRDDLKGVQNLKKSKDDIEINEENGVVLNRKDVIPSPVIEGIPDIFNTPPERISVGINNEKLSPKKCNSIEKLTDDNLIEEILTANVKEQQCKNLDIEQHQQQRRQKFKLIQFSTSSCESIKSQQSIDCTDHTKDDNYYYRLDSKNFNKKLISNQLPNHNNKLDYKRQEISSKQKFSPSTSEDDDYNTLMPSIVMVSTKDNDNDDNNDMRKLLQSIKINNNDDQHPHHHFHYLQYNYHQKRQLQQNNDDGYENHLFHDYNNPSNKNGDSDGIHHHFDSEFIKKLENVAATRKRGEYENINRIKKSKLLKSESSTSTTSSSYENFILNDVNNVCMTRRKSVNEMIQYWNNQLNLNAENAKNEKKLSNEIEQNHHNHQSNNDLHFLNTNRDVRV